MNKDTYLIYFKRAEYLDGEAECYEPREGVACYSTDNGQPVHILCFWPGDTKPYFENGDNDVVAEGWSEVIVREAVVINRP